MKHKGILIGVVLLVLAVVIFFIVKKKKKIIASTPTTGNNIVQLSPLQGGLQAAPHGITSAQLQQLQQYALNKNNS